MANATLVASLVKPPSQADSELTALPEAVEWLEVRADLSGDLDPHWLRNHFRGQLLYTLRSREEDGGFQGTSSERRERLLEAARRYNLIDLEGERDLTPEILAEIPPHKRLISWHGAATDLSALRSRFSKLSTVEARFYKLVTKSTQVVDTALVSEIPWSHGHAGFHHWADRFLEPYSCRSPRRSVSIR
jgi:3-dehydroquinate dehydratase/shikimate dehydrogenase